MPGSDAQGDSIAVSHFTAIAGPPGSSSAKSIKRRSSFLRMSRSTRTEEHRDVRGQMKRGTV